MEHAQGRGLDQSLSLPQSTIEQLQLELSKARAEIEELMFVDYWKERYDSAKKQIELLSLENAILRRRVESLEGVT